MEEALGTELFALLVFLTVITIPLKGWAMWLAAQRRERVWFVVFLISNTMGVVELIYIYFIAKRSATKNDDEHTNDGSDGDDNDINPTHDQNYRLPGY